MGMTSFDITQEKIDAGKRRQKQQNDALLRRQGFTPGTKTIARPQARQPDPEPDNAA